MEALRSGQKIADRFTVTDPAGGPNSWFARDADDSQWVVKAALKAERPPGFFHPSVVFYEEHAGFQLRPFYHGVAERATTIDEARRLAEALVALHAAGSLHGNIRPSNILLRDGGSPLLVDPRPQRLDEATEDVRDLARSLAHLGLDSSEPSTASLLENAEEGQLSAREFHDRIDDIIAGARHDSQEPGIVIREMESSAPREPSRGRTRALVGAGLALALAALLYVVVFLPGEQPAPPAPAPVAEQPSPQPEPEVIPPSAEELEALLAARQRAQAALDEAILLRLELMEKQVETWAADAFEDAQQEMAAGDAAFRNQQFRDAQTAYETARDALSDLSDRGEEVAGNAIADGASALERGDAEAATAAFEMAERIWPNHEAIAQGLQRAATLDQAMALFEETLRLEDDGNLTQAIDTLDTLRSLDPLFPDLEERRARYVEEIRSRDYRSAMSEGLAAMNAGDLASARAALKRAQQLNPDDPAAREHLQEIERLGTVSEIDNHRRKAGLAMEAEDWPLAIAHFEASLRRDPNLEFAQAGLNEARERLQLEQSIQEKLDAPQRWWSDSGRATVRDLLSSAEDVVASTERHNRLRSLMQQLASALTAASEPVEVTLQSDSQCNVVVYRVARLGAFDSRQLTLKPGYYTAVGTRDGYRDVRREFLVPANRSPQPVTLVCDEAV